MEEFGVDTTRRSRKWQSAIVRWARSHLGGLRHEKRVLAIARSLFGLTVPLHGLGRRERRLLCVAALLHDVGRCQGPRRHHVRGARLILGDERLPLEDAERRAVAYLTRYHRGRASAERENDILRPGDGRRTLRVLLALLRTADALDNRRCPARSLTVRRQDDRLVICCRVRPDHHTRMTRVLSRGKKFSLLRDTLGLRVTVRVEDTSIGWLGPKVRAER